MASTTSISVTVRNSATSLLALWRTGITGLIFNIGEITASNRVTATYGSLNKGGIFSKSTIRNTNTFYGVKSFYVSNENILDFSLSLTTGQITADSQNSRMLNFIVDYIIIESVEVCGNGLI